MKALAIAPYGFSETAASEIEEISGCRTRIVSGGIEIDVPDAETIAKITMFSQSIRKIMQLVLAVSYDELYDSIGRMPYIENRTFRVNCVHHGNDLSSMDVAGDVGGMILKKNPEAKVDMDEPDVIVLVYVYENTAYLGIDFAGIDLSKRDYKIYNHPASLNGAFAYNLLRFSGWKTDETMLDPMCGSGIIPIEAAIAASGRAVQGFRKDRMAFTRIVEYDVPDAVGEHPKKASANILCSDHMLACIRAAKNNAKIADVLIKPSKNDLEWLETKHDEKSVMRIVTHPPSLSKHSNPKELAKTYNELFYQAEYILDDAGSVAILVISPDMVIEAAEKNRFRLEKDIVVFQGEQKHHALLFRKEKKEKTEKY